MNNDNDDDRDNNSADQRRPSTAEPDPFRKEPTFSLFDNDTELEVDDIEAEDFASDYAGEGYDDEPFEDNEFADEALPPTEDEEVVSAEDPIGSVWVDDDHAELNELSPEQPDRTPWDDEPDATMAEDYSVDTELESSLAPVASVALPQLLQLVQKTSHRLSMQKKTLRKSSGKTKSTTMRAMTTMKTMSM